MNHYTTYCWSCGTILHVPHDRTQRNAKTAGENTVDNEKRLCVQCWKEIGRRNLAIFSIQS